MKTKNLILMMAIFALSLSSVYAQFVPRVLDCVDLDNPLTPVPGNSYTYSVNVPNPPGTKDYLWFVTQDINLIVNGALTNNREPSNFSGSLLASGDGHYNLSTQDADSIRLTWKTFILNPNEYVFVVIQVVNDNGTCETNNMKVYRIQPLHAFSLDIANVQRTNGSILGNDYGSNINYCISDVQTATFNPAQNAIVYDFGRDSLYYAIIAANWSAAWQLSVQLAGLQSSQTADIYWDYTFNGQTNVITTGATNGTFVSSNAITPQSGTSVGADGEIIYIKVVIHHGSQFEGTGNDDFQYTLSVNGELGSIQGANFVGLGNTYKDIHHVGDPNCVIADFDDLAYQTLTRRPQINAVSPNYLPIGN